MKSRVLQIFSLALICVAAIPDNAYCDLILNGSFESPVVSSETQFTDGQIIGSGWTVVSGNTAFIIPDSAGQGATPFGVQFLEIHADTIEQIVTGLTPGNSYQLTYAATAQSNANYNGTGQITATIAGVSDVYEYALTGQNLYGSPASPWVTRSVLFQATASQETLRFTGSGSLNSNPLGAIDNVQILAVPEPSSLILLLGCATVLKTCQRENRRLFAQSKLAGLSADCVTNGVEVKAFL